MADFMLEGGYRRHLRRVRQIYSERRNALLRSLEKNFGSVDVSGEDAGMHLIWTIPDQLLDAGQIERRALECGIGVYTASTGSALHFGPDAASSRRLLHRYAALTPKEIEHGISRLAHIVHSETSQSSFASIANGNGGRP